MKQSLGDGAEEPVFSDLLLGGFVLSQHRHLSAESLQKTQSDLSVKRVRLTPLIHSLISLFTECQLGSRCWKNMEVNQSWLGTSGDTSVVGQPPQDRRIQRQLGVLRANSTIRA